MPELETRVALVTGAGRGIGRAVALELAKRGATVIVNENSNEDAAHAATEVVETINGAGGQASAIQADVSKYHEAEALIRTSLDRHGKLDILVNNAGIVRFNLIMMMKEEEWDAVINTNLKGAWNCSKFAVKAMLRNRYGRIVNMSSVSGIMGQAANVNYSASKAGLIGLTKALAREVAPRQITVNAVAPGFIDIGMSHHFSPEIAADLLKQVPFGMPGNAQDVANAVAFLASDEASYITGQVLAVDGGLSMA
jgi:3-oxoacyl-[acyl-carrier protein] reductase